MGHLIDAHRHRQDQHIILTRIDRNTVAVAQAEPLLGDFRHLVAAFADGVLVIQDVALHIQVWARP